jgi:DNA-binding NarL/FixJ family response regulator
MNSYQPTHITKLTNREAQVLDPIGRGVRSSEVADELFLRKRTVDFHLASIYRKLNVTNRVQALRQATLLDSRETNPPLTTR